MELNIGVLDVVEVVMKYSELDFLPCLHGIVEDALRQLSNSSHQKSTYCLLKIFYTFIVCMRMILKDEDTKVTEKDTQIINNCSETIINSLLEYYNAKNIDKKLEDEDATEDTKLDADLLNIDPSEKKNEPCTDSSAEGILEKFISIFIYKFLTRVYIYYFLFYYICNCFIDEQENEKLPIHIMILIKIMKSCLNFLPSNDIQTSLMAMQTLQAGLTMLAKWEDELLPIVHQLWHPLIDRFNDGNVLVINRAWQLLHILASVSNDFIRSRTLR